MVFSYIICLFVMMKEKWEHFRNIFFFHRRLYSFTISWNHILLVAEKHESQKVYRFAGKLLFYRIATDLCFGFRELFQTSLFSAL